MSTKMAALCVAMLSGCMFGQTTTGTLLGTVVDPGDAAVPGAMVELKNVATGAVATTSTGAEGIFRFNSLVPATYNLIVRPNAGFKTYSQNSIEVTASEVRDLGRLSLSLGALTEQVSVTATATPVQTASGENSKLIDPAQMSNITLKGRDLFGLLVMLPGVTTAQQDTTSENSIGSVRINGGPYGGLANFTVDGISDTDTANNTTLHFEPNMDAIAEIRVLTANYQAEYGRNSSGAISIVTKGGSQEFHGSGWTNKRHEMFNAKSFFQNFNGQQKSVYRFFVWGYSIGGPLYIPKLFNTQKRKLFFFFSQEYTKQKPATQSGYANVPTAAQRAGDFSGYTDTNGVPFSLTDPSTGNPIPNNNITSLAALNPAAAKAGQAILNFLPLPNICGHQGVDPGNCIQDAQYGSQRYARNYYWQFNEVHPRRNDTLRLDYNVTQKLNTWVRYINDYDMDQTNGNIELKNAAGNPVAYSNDHPNPGHGYGVGITYTISPTMVNEFTFGKSYNSWDYYAHDQSQLDRSRMANPPSFNNFATDPLFTGDQNKSKPAGLGTGSIFYQTGVPNISFGGGQEPNEISFNPNCSGQCPYSNWNDIYSINNNLSKVMGKHNLKAGFYYEKTGKVEIGSGSQGSYLGSYSFGSSTAMPNNTQDGYANAFLGNFNSYSEGGRAIGNFWYSEVEFFVQDNFRVSRRVTLDVGLRLSHVVPTENLNGNNAAWLRSSYNPAQAERIYLPGCTVSTAARACPTANQVAVDPLTGKTTFFSLQGTLVPAAAGGYTGTPSPTPGMEVADGKNPNLPMQMYTHSPLIPAVRLGVAWDVFGNGKTAVRAGFGQFVNLTDSHFAQLASGNPPNTINRTIYYNTVDKVPSFANVAAITPIAPQATIGAQPVEENYNGTFMIQQRVPASTVVEASYVFNLSKHTWAQHQLNAVAPFSEYNPAYNNPTVDYLPANVSGKALSDNYFRPLPGLGALLSNDLSGNSSYNSLQVAVRRSMTHHLAYGLAYTFSKTMTAYNAYPAGASPYFPDKFRNYGPAYSPTPHVLAVNYIYELPNPGRQSGINPLGWVTDHWTISGITQWRSDIRVAVPGISFSGTTATNPQMNWTGGYEGARMMVVGNPQLPSGQVSFAGSTPLVQAPGANANGTPGNQILNESVFVIPMPCSWTPGPTPQQGIGQSSSCYGNAGAGSLIPLPGTRTLNFDMTFGKAFPLKGERRQIIFRAEAYNIFNHTQFTGANITPTYSWPLWQTGVLQQTNANLGRYTSAANPRQMSLSLRLQF
jgi:hypothetical protein